MAMAAATMSSRLYPGAGPRLPRSGLVQIGCLFGPPSPVFGVASLTESL